MVECQVGVVGVMQSFSLFFSLAFSLKYFLTVLTLIGHQCWNNTQLTSDTAVACSVLVRWIHCIQRHSSETVHHLGKEAFMLMLCCWFFRPSTYISHKKEFVLYTHHTVVKSLSLQRFPLSNLLVSEPSCNATGHYSESPSVAHSITLHLFLSVSSNPPPV